MTANSAITSVLDTEDFAEYEQNVYEKYQEKAECEIISKLNALFSNILFLNEQPRLKNVVSFRPIRPFSAKPKGPC